MLRFLRSTPILLAAILVGFYADLLFYDKPLGLSLILFVLFFSGALFIVGKKEGVTAARKNLWLLLPLLFFAGMVAIRDNAFIRALNVLAVAGLLAYLLLYYAVGRVGELGLMPAMILPLFTAAKSLLAARPIMAEAVNGPRVYRHTRTNLFPIVRGGLLAMPVLFIFTLLLASADLIFASQIGGLFSISNISQLFRLILRGWLIFGISWIVTGGLVLALDKKDYAADLDSRFARLGRFRFLGYTESTTLLILVDLLFLAFVFVQFRYLFGGESNINLAGYTYAEYARRGFFELLAVAILSLGLILGLEALTWRESKRQFKVFSFLSSLMLLLVVFMLVSAFQRMRLYEATFGYTELRLYVYVFMIWLGLFLLWFLVGLWRRPDRFALGALVIVMGFIATLNLLNPDAFIVRQNVARYWIHGDLDAYYLNTLSADAVPALVSAFAAVEEAGVGVGSLLCETQTDDRSEKICPAEISGVLREGLLDRYQEMLGERDWRRWQSFQLSRWQAYGLMKRMFFWLPPAVNFD